MTTQATKRGARQLHPESPEQRLPKRIAALAGVLAAAAALTAGELAGRVVPAASPPLVALGDAVVRLAPPGLRDAGISTFGTADKPVLLATITAVVVLLAAVIGIRARSKPLSGETYVVVLAAAPLLAGFVSSGGFRAAELVPSAAMAVTGVLLLRALLGLRVWAAPTLLPDPAEPSWSRRVFLVRAGAVLVAVAAGGAVASWLDQRVDVNALRKLIRLPVPMRVAPGNVAASSLQVPGLSPLITPNAEFYRIDTALAVPRIDSATWLLQVKGMVDRPVTLSYADLLALPQYEADITLQCVSNEVGGDLVGNARWQGVLLRDVLTRAGVQAGADQVVGRSVDDFTAGFPTALAMDGRAAMIALGMNGEPLPQEHGFPARLIVPGLYGYVSATKWLTSIELTTLAGFDGFWVPRGWAKLGPIKTESRIDVPADGDRVSTGQTVIAGVAWSPGPRRGIQQVEVQVDNGPWLLADLGGELSEDSWRQWRVTAQLTAGAHLLSVRATDRTGRVQDERVRPPRPDGATGHHQIRVLVG